ncbi:MAG: hypothetical protein ACP5P3_03435 [Ignavibacteria bacterium]
MNLVILLILAVLKIFQNSYPDIYQLRSWFESSVENSNTAEKFYNELNKIPDAELSPLVLAYKGASICIMAKHTFSPFKKLAYLEEGLLKINKAIKQNRNNAEIYYIRYCIESSIPFFLGMSQHLENDINNIVTLLLKKRKWETIDIKIYKFLLNEDTVSDEQKTQLSNHYKTVYE